MKRATWFLLVCGLSACAEGTEPYQHDDTAFTDQPGSVQASLDFTPATTYPSTVSITVGNPAFSTDDATLERFGYRRFRVNGYLAQGSRPLVTVRLGYADNKFEPRHDAEYYRQRLFGPDFPNVADWYREMSLNRFTWADAGSYFVQMRDDPSTPWDESRRACAWAGNKTCTGYANESRLRAQAIRELASQGFPFARYDVAPRDGVINGNELEILVIDAAPSSDKGAAVRRTDPGCVRPTGSAVDVCIAVAGASESTELVTIGHELMHLLGPEDVYGDSCNSYQMTLMSCTGDGSEGTFHIDARGKLGLGWIRPRVQRMDRAGTCTTLVDGTEEEPLLLYSPVQGTREFFVLEHRRGGVYERYDNSLASSGVAIWHVKNTDGGWLDTVPGTTILAGANLRMDSFLVLGSDDWMGTSWGNPFIASGPDRLLQAAVAGDDMLSRTGAMMLVSAPIGALPAYRQGAGGAWTPSHGAFDLRWYDGTSTGYYLKVTREFSDAASVAMGPLPLYSTYLIPTAKPTFVDGTGGGLSWCL